MSVVRGCTSKCLICVLVGLALATGRASAEEPQALGGTGTSLMESPLVVPEAQPLLGSEAVSSAEETRLASPEAVAAREESQTKWEGLGTAEAAELAERAFPEVIESPDGGLQLPEDESVTEYPTDNAAQIQLPTGARGVAESLAPIAVEAASGQRVPVDLGLMDVGGAFEPADAGGWGADPQATAGRGELGGHGGVADASGYLGRTCRWPPRNQGHRRILRNGKGILGVSD
jgi:hypothetical protein